MPMQIDKLENLETLDVFIVGNQDVGGSSVKALGKRPKRRGNSCDFCTTLPPLGQLPSLKELQIDDMSKVETIGS
jgi:hypothetical protein